ncbi:hypothetical protein BX600DRAFT_534407 [Xylariales sp. PMI_506]|nr:hypothetical protein BX600DRAFT_534407 [Xylariales sp. PMI_506]
MLYISPGSNAVFFDDNLDAISYETFRINCFNALRNGNAFAASLTYADRKSRFDSFEFTPGVWWFLVRQHRCKPTYQPPDKWSGWHLKNQRGGHCLGRCHQYHQSYQDPAALHQVQVVYNDPLTKVFQPGLIMSYLSALGAAGI